MKGLNIFAFDLIESYFCFEISNVGSHHILYLSPAKDMVGTVFILEQSLLIFFCEFKKICTFSHRLQVAGQQRRHIQVLATYSIILIINESNCSSPLWCKQSSILIINTYPRVTDKNHKQK